MSNYSRAKPQAAKGGFTLIAVLVIVGSALLIATSLLFIAQAEVAGASHAGGAAQSRAMIESGLEVVMQRLQAQRERILAGERLELDEQYELWEAAGTLGVVRLLPVTADNQRLQGEAGKIDLNAPWLTVEGLIATGMVEPAVAEAIMQNRGNMMHSVAALLDVPGITAEMLYGPLEEMLEDDTTLAEGDILERVASRFTSDEPRGLADIFTVFAVEPDLQRDGRRRINLNVPWSDELGSRLDDRFGDGAGEIIRQIMQDTAFDDMATVIHVLLRFDVPSEDWPDILDALTASDETYSFGRIDLNTASEAALLGLPEMAPEQAAAIVRSRDTLTEDERTTIVWPLLRGIVEREVYVHWADAVTTRSWTYRVRLAAGEVDAEEPTGELQNPVVFEAVFDLAGPEQRPRVAYLRDVTYLRATAMLALADSPGNSNGRDWYDEVERPWAEPAIGGLEEDAALLDWPDEEESWPTDDLADDIDIGAPSEALPEAPADNAPPSRRRLGRWRGG